MGSALLDTRLDPAQTDPATQPSPETLRRQVAERLAAHRSRRGQSESPAQTQPHGQASGEPSRSGKGRSARIAAAVAERYAHTQTYRAFLAAEAERAVQQANAAAEIARLNAQAVAAAQQRLLEAFDECPVQHDAEPDAAATEAPGTPEARIAPGQIRPLHREELSLWPEDGPANDTTPPAKNRASRAAAPPRRAPAKTPQTSPVAEPARTELTVRLYQEAGVTARPASVHTYRGSSLRAERQSEADPEALALDEEIAFRQAPVFEEPAGPPTPLPANLIEFPRQLVASRKARPRLAEGPLRDEAGPKSGEGQLRIFEVDPAQISTEPAPVAEPDPQPAPQWTAIWLDTPASASSTASASQPGFHNADSSLDSPAATPLPGVASIRRRVLAAGIDAGIGAAALGVFAAALIATTQHAIPWHSIGPLRSLLLEIAGRVPSQPGFDPHILLEALAVAGAFLYLLYQTLFFSLDRATPGMRCAHIALCTFNDENPTRAAMRRRMAAVLLSACPLGLGFLWAALDEERLAWHDRISRTYQRSY